jgi:hypothetical protein
VVPPDAPFDKWLLLYKQWIQIPEYKKVKPSEYVSPTTNVNGITSSIPYINFPESIYNTTSLTKFKRQSTITETITDTKTNTTTTTIKEVEIEYDYHFDVIVPTNIHLHSNIVGSDTDDDFFVCYANNLPNHKRFYQSDSNMSEVVVWYKDSNDYTLDFKTINMKYKIELVLETN